ncbi:hypothetical protein HQ545_06285 [Candidatus Woesearchaeota archaeon]|nr:hypothetical protein [Candidatus Woesearchaeota archaeon]
MVPQKPNSENKMNVNRATIDTVLEAYRPESRYLVASELEYPEITGQFRIKSSFYAFEETGHLNAVDLFLCYNQLSYVLLAESGRMGLIEKLRLFPIEQFKQHQLSDCLIVGMTDVRFKRPIPSDEFEGHIRLVKTTVKSAKGLYFFRTTYDFGHGAATGTVDLALRIKSDSY